MFHVLLYLYYSYWSPTECQLIAVVVPTTELFAMWKTITENDSLQKFRNVCNSFETFAKIWGSFFHYGARRLVLSLLEHASVL